MSVLGAAKKTAASPKDFRVARDVNSILNKGERGVIGGTLDGGCFFRRPRNQDLAHACEYTVLAYVEGIL